MNAPSTATDDVEAIRFDISTPSAASHAIVGTMSSLLTCSSGVFTDRAAPAIDKDEDDDECIKYDE